MAAALGLRGVQLGEGIQVSRRLWFCLAFLVFKIVLAFQHVHEKSAPATIVVCGFLIIGIAIAAGVRSLLPPVTPIDPGNPKGSGMKLWKLLLWVVAILAVRIIVAFQEHEAPDNAEAILICGFVATILTVIAGVLKSIADDELEGTTTTKDALKLWLLYKLITGFPTIVIGIAALLMAVFIGGVRNGILGPLFK